MFRILDETLQARMKRGYTTSMEELGEQPRGIHPRENDKSKYK